MVAWSEETPTVLRSEESVETKLLRVHSRKKVFAKMVATPQR